MTQAQLKQDLVDAIMMMERAKIMDFNGHFSARLSTGHFLINSGKSIRSRLTAADVVAVDLDGELIEGRDAPPMELFIHAEIYRRRPDVQAVVHAHPLWSTLFSSAGVPIRPVIMQAAVLGDIQLFSRTESINHKGIGEEAARALGPHRVLSLRSHGVAIAAEGVKEAFVLAVYLEDNAYRQYMARALGEPYVLSRDELALAAKNLWKPNLIQKVWDYYQTKLE